MYNHIKLNMEDQLILFKELLTLKSDIFLTVHKEYITLNINNQDLSNDSKIFDIFHNIYKQTQFNKHEAYQDASTVIEDVYLRTTILSALEPRANNNKLKPTNCFVISFRLITHPPVIQKNITKIEEELIKKEENILNKIITKPLKINKKRL